MPPTLLSFMELLNSPTFGLWQTIALVYVGLLWLSIIIWVTRDSIHRSSSLLFQVFAILINIAIPILGVLLYLIIRPAKTSAERYYEDLEQYLLSEAGDKVTCEECLAIVEKDFLYCPHCAQKLQKACTSCKKSFSNAWNICPYCGKTSQAASLKVATKAKAKSTATRKKASKS